MLEKLPWRPVRKKPQGQRVDDELLQAESQQNHADIGSERGEQIEPQPRCHGKSETGDAERSEFQREADDRHAHLEHPFEKSLQHGGLLGFRDSHRHADKQAEDHQREQAAAGVFGVEGVDGLGEWIFGNEIQKRRGDRLGAAAALDTFLRGAAVGGNEGFAFFLRQGVAGFKKVHEPKRNADSSGGEKNRRYQCADADSTQRANVPHFERSKHDGRKNQRHDDHENDPQKNPTRWLDHLIDPPVERGLRGFWQKGSGRKSQRQSQDKAGQNARGLGAVVRTAGHRQRERSP